MQEQLQGREEHSTSSLSSELVREEVRRQVQLAMAEKNKEVMELRQQNEDLKRVTEINAKIRPEEGQGQAPVPVRGQAGRASIEPAQNLLAQEHGVGGPCGGLLGLQRGAGVSGSNPFGAGEQHNVPAGDLEGLLDRRVRDDRRLGLGEVPPKYSPGPVHSAPANNSDASLTEPLHLLVQGMRQLQQAYIGKSDFKDVEFKGSIDIPEMPDLGAESSVAFADWLYELEAAIGGLSDKASIWFAASLEVARQAYVEYTSATPVARISLQPKIPEELKDLNGVDWRGGL